MPAFSSMWSWSPPRVSPRVGYAIAAILPALVLLLELPLRRQVLQAPYALFFVGITVTAWLGGRGPGFTAVLVSAALVNACMLPSVTASARLVGTTVFALGSGVAALLVASLRAALAARGAQELRFRSLVTATAQMIWTTTAEGEVVEDSPSWRAFTGQTYEELRGAGWLGAVHPDDRDLVARTFREAVASRSRYEIEYRVRRPDGSYTPTLARAAPVIGPDGRVLEWVGTNTDISIRRRAEQALRESEEKFRTLIETIPQIVFTSNLDGSSDFHNSQTLAYTGLTAQQLRDWGWRTVYHPDDLPQALEAYGRALAGAKPCTIGTFRLRRHDGAYRWFLVSVGPLRVLDGSIVKWFGVATDIQEQKRWEEEQARAIAARDAFLSVASHELKTPVAAAVLQIQQVRRALDRGSDPGSVRRGVAASESAVERLGRLVETLLDVSRIAGDGLALERASYDLSASISLAASRFGDQASRAGSVLELDVEPGVHVIGDRLRLEQVITSLLGNAIRFGAGRPVSVSLRRHGERAILRVSDRGIGISPDDQSRIFDRFERAVSVRNFGGLGLGLWISRHIVEASGGAIRVESAPGRGATFTVELPLSSQDDARPAPAGPGARLEHDTLR
jgi:PAS domain S-box-containing protein